MRFIILIFLKRVFQHQKVDEENCVQYARNNMFSADGLKYTLKIMAFNVNLQKPIQA